MERLNELERKYEELGKEIERLKSGDRLELEVYHRALKIRYNGVAVGIITADGYCNILSNEGQIKTYEQWRADGMPVDESVVEWRGGWYRLESFYNNQAVQLFRSDIDNGQIYDFVDCRPEPYCEDPNIKRFKHNNRPIIY